MVIRSSSARQAQDLVTALRDRDPVTREAAIARLRVLGARAVTRLATLVRQDREPGTREAALKALDGIEDPRVITVALDALRDPDDQVRLAAITTLRPWVVREAGTGVMDALLTLVLDRAQTAGVRLAAREALAELPRDIVQPILEEPPPDAPPPTDSEEPSDIREWLAAHDTAPLSSLHALIAHAREREAGERQTARRTAWLALRGTIHAMLAARHSRVALYDLREAFDGAATPLPRAFLDAMTTIGDATCLEPMARAWAAAREEAWRRDLETTATAIVTRLRLTGRHAAVRKVRSRWPGLLGRSRSISDL